MLNTAALLIPVFLLIVLFEWYISYKSHNNRYTTANTTMNLTIGAIDQIVSLASFALLFIVMEYMYNHYRIVHVENIWYQWIGGYIAVDFLSYWYHRWSHRINILWAGHITHHSSEHFNFSNGFRTSPLQGINRIVFWALLPVFGFSPVALILIFKISGLFDFLQHTEYIPKLKYIDKILVTPSAHRVHHGRNEKYIDKNYGSNFIIWDKLFGTYQEETEKVNYGITSSYKDINPLSAIGFHYQYMWNTIKAARRWQDKIKVPFMPPEWKPEIIEAVNMPEHKVSTTISKQENRYAWFQLAACTTGIITLLAYYNYLTYGQIMLLSIIAISEMSNVTMIFNKSIAAKFEKRELTRILLGIILILISLYLWPNKFIWIVLVYLFISFFLIFPYRNKTDHFSDAFPA